MSAHPESPFDPAVHNPSSTPSVSDDGAIGDRVEPTTPSRFESNPTTYVSVLGPQHVFIGIRSREDFDKIALPCVEVGPNHKGHVLCKHLESAGVSVVFQHWIQQVTLDALVADLQARRQGKS